MKVAVIGAGWAGLAASVALREADAKVTVFEAGR
ncbi:NAD(P)-binding protein, partial [Bordetella pertussis]